MADAPVPAADSCALALSNDLCTVYNATAADVLRCLEIELAAPLRKMEEFN